MTQHLQLRYKLTINNSKQAKYTLTYCNNSQIMLEANQFENKLSH